MDARLDRLGRSRRDGDRNDGGNRNHWLAVKLEGTKSNRDALGAVVTVTAGGRRIALERQSGGSYLSDDPKACATCCRPTRDSSQP